ncbi:MULTISPECIES: 4'-phosphopantetheinyl transferase family protein [Dickeya]|uniref:4'-phosphopantetheinyl transferase family protein n=1 Tax=Dickeya TaxID=204037 RepID=UPI0002E5B959|nr:MULTISPECIES: 4'-phosphopantetheinyl transferase [Dickeya]AJC68289.1 phosphopantetheinyl transferase [Dickeya zeae EC1]
MTCHFVRWASTEALPDLQRLSDDLISSTHSLSVKRRERYLKSRALLAEMMFYFFGYPILPPLMVSPNGRPCFVDPHLPDFSLGYAGNTIAILLSEEGKVGMDVEIVRVWSRETPPHLQTQTHAEKAWIDAQIDPLEAATQLCTIRQSVLKIPGFNIGGPESLKLHPASGRLRSRHIPDVEVISDIDDYLAWACAHTPRLDRLVMWNYTSAYGMRKSGEIIQQQRQSRRYIKLSSHATENASAQYVM